MTSPFDTDELESSRRLMIDAAKHGSLSAACAQVWERLIGGHTQIVDTFTTSERAYLIVTRTTGVRPRVMGRSLAILERVLLGSSAKAVAIDLDISQSTVAGSLRTSLETLGLHDRPSRVPLGLAMLVHAARAQNPTDMDQASGLRWRGLECDVLSAPIASLSPVLSPAVQAVAFLHAQGNSHAEIAARRCTSTRTVANQIAMAFQRLGISGRSALLGYLILTPRSGAHRRPAAAALAAPQ